MGNSQIADTATTKGKPKHNPPSKLEIASGLKSLSIVDSVVVEA